MSKAKHIGLTVLKIVLGVIAVIAVVLIALYCYLRFALGIDIIDIKQKLDLLNQPVSESQLISNSFEEQDGVSTLNKLFGDNQIYNNTGDEVSFNLEAFAAAALQQNTSLSDKELAAMFSLFFENVDFSTLGLTEDYAKI